QATPTLFPYTTLFRSATAAAANANKGAPGRAGQIGGPLKGPPSPGYAGGFVSQRQFTGHCPSIGRFSVKALHIWADGGDRFAHKDRKSTRLNSSHQIN